MVTFSVSRYQPLVACSVKITCVTRNATVFSSDGTVVDGYRGRSLPWQIVTVVDRYRVAKVKFFFEIHFRCVLITPMVMSVLDLRFVEDELFCDVLVAG